jgi:LacI family transcriptional regulator, galactose operon repressor
MTANRQRPGRRGPRPRRAVTLRVIAREAGVSASTVSRIINGTVKVSDDLKAAVDAAIAKHDFRPDAAARGLALGRTLTIGVLSQSIDSPFYAEGLRGVELRLLQAGYAALFMSGNWNEVDEERCMRQFIDRGVDGIIMFSGRLSDAAVKVFAKRVPIVVTGRSLKAPGVCSLPIDDRHGALLAMRHLIGLGHRRIAFIAGSENHPDALQRLAGYKEALQEAKIPFDPGLIAVGDWHEEGGLRATTQLFAAGHDFTAIFCVNDQTARGVYLGLFRKGLSIPKDISVVGFDDLPSSSYTVPPLTSVRQSVGVLGERSAEGILALIAGRRPRVQSPAVEIVLRDSTRPL